MMIWFTALHALAYAPAALFHSFDELWGALWNSASHAYENWSEYQYAAAIIVLIVCLYPFLFFFFLLQDGFNPYDELTYQETRLEGGVAADLAYWMRMCLHLFLVIVTIYLILLIIAYKVVCRW